MKNHSHPFLTTSGILLCVVTGFAGTALLEASGNAVLLFITLVLSAAVWLGIIIDHDRNTPSMYPEEPTPPASSQEKFQQRGKF